MRKYTIEELREFIEIQSNSGCKLISKEYQDCKSKLLIQCRCGNVFQTNFDTFKNKGKTQCNECTNDERKLKLEDIKKYCDKNIDGYQVIAIEYKKKNGIHSTFAFIQCPNINHPPYWVSWQKVLRGQRCQKCYYESRKDRALIWNKDRILDLLNKFELSVVDINYEFINSKHKVLCKNKDGYLVDVNINSLANGQTPHPFQRNKYAIQNLDTLGSKMGLKLTPNQTWKGIKNKYSFETTEGYKVSTWVESIIEGCQPRIFHPSNSFTIENIKMYCKKNRHEYYIVSTKYKGKNEKLLFKYIGNKKNMTDDERYFNVSFEKFRLDNQGHPWFNQSKAEILIEQWLIKNNISYCRQYTFNDCKKIRKLRFDFAIFRNDKLFTLIEYQGSQHYSAIDHFGGIEKFEIQNKNDNIKSDYCKTNKIPLLIIPFWDFKGINDILSKSLL